MELWMWLLFCSPAAAVTVNVEPADDWCDAIRSAAPGDTVALSAGEFAGPCTIDHGGAEGAPVRVTAQDPDSPPLISYAGTSSNVIDVLVSDVTLSGLTFGPTNPDIDAIKIKAGSRVTIEGCTFTGTGGISVAANSTDGDANAVLGCTFTDLQATGLYFGCHDGTCKQTDVRIEDNVFDGVTSTAVGYAMELKLDSWGIVARNAIRDTKGPGIEIYGSSDGSVYTTVEQNLVFGGASGAIEIGGGPAIVRNNIVVGSTGGGIVSYDYGGRGLVRAVKIIGNTAIGEGAAAFSISGWTQGADLDLQDNAGLQRGNGVALPASIPGIPMEGNVECGPACFVDEASLDLWPAEGGGLIDMGVTPSAALVTDFCGQPRSGAPDVGAFEWVADGTSGGSGPGPIAFGAWSTFACDTGGDGTGGPDDSGDVLSASGGCGCSSSRSSSGSWSGSAGGLLAGLGSVVSAMARRRAGPAR